MDDATRLMQQMERFTVQVNQEMAVEQVTHIDLADYQPGAARYERLQVQLEQCRRFESPKDLFFNV